MNSIDLCGLEKDVFTASTFPQALFVKEGTLQQHSSHKTPSLNRFHKTGWSLFSKRNQHAKTETRELLYINGKAMYIMQPFSSIRNQENYLSYFIESKNGLGWKGLSSSSSSKFHPPAMGRDMSHQVRFPKVPNF